MIKKISALVLIFALSTISFGFANVVLDNSKLGLATSAAQATQQTSLSAIQASVGNIPTSPSTAALQSTANTALAAIQASVANIPASPSTSALQSSGNSILSSILSALQGTLSVQSSKVASANITAVSNSASSFSVVASNAARNDLKIVNNSTVNCELAYGATASATLFTYLMRAGTTFEMVPGAIYTGALSAICDSASGTLQVTEM